MLSVWEAGVGGEENARGAKAVDFKQETWADGELASLKRRHLSSKLLLLANSK